MNKTPKYNLAASVKVYFESGWLARLPPVSDFLAKEHPGFRCVSIGAARAVSDSAKDNYSPESRLGNPQAGLHDAVQAARLWAQLGMALDGGIEQRRASLQHADRMYGFAQRIAAQFGLDEVSKGIYAESEGVRSSLSRALKRDVRQRYREEKTSDRAKRIRKHGKHH